MDEQEKGCENMTLTQNTKIGLTFGQILSLITIAGAFTLGYAELNSRITNLEKGQTQSEQIRVRQEEINSKLTETTYDIKQTLIRIEGKLDLKADKNWIK